MPRKPPSLSDKQMRLGKFSKVMGMEESLCKQMRVTIRKVALNHFDIKKTMPMQPNNNWKSFEAEVSELFPRIAENPERLEYIRAYAWKFFRDEVSRTRNSRSVSPDDIIQPMVLAPTGDAHRQHTRPSTSDSSSKIDIAAVLGFLKTCQPVMTHLLPTFLDIGLRNGKTLEDIASLPHDCLWDTIFHFQSKGLLTDYESDAVFQGIIALGSETS